MPNLYNKLMAKDMPGAAPAPTSRQMVQAPMGLRSAMKRYADGGELSSFSGEDGRSNQSLSFPQLSDSDEARRYEIAKIMQEMDTRRPSEPARYSPDPVRPPPEPVRYSPPETVRPPEVVRPPPPPPEEPRYQPDPGIIPYAPPIAPKPNPNDVSDPYPFFPDPYPSTTPTEPQVRADDFRPVEGPRTTGSTQTQQVGPRTSYRQEADGTMTEIGYDGQPVSGYTQQQWAMHNATTGVTPSKFQYVWNGEGYDKVPTGAQIGYNPMENVAPQIPDNMPIDTSYNRDEGYSEPPMFDTTQETPFDPIEYQNKQSQNESQRFDLLKRALSGQGVGSLMESQRLAQLLQSLGYSK